MTALIEIRPQEGPQELFLSTPADIAIYGGSAGGGKTWALMAEPLRHVANSRFGAVIFRRSYAEITKEGGMWDESRAIYPLLGGSPVRGDLYYRFPSGARISFGHLQYEDTLEDWKGAQITLLAFDQLETFTERQFFYMLSRNRSLCGVRPYVRASCNPEPGWLADFLSWWIAEDGYADMSRAGKLRWMVRKNEQVCWGDSREEMLETHGDESHPLSVTFIPATVYDNKLLMQKNPEYVANLMALSLVDRARLLGDKKRGGNWKIKPSAGKVFNRDWFEIVEAVPASGRVVRRWDFAATEKELTKPDPDFTASVLMLVVNGTYYILNVTNERMEPAGVERAFMNRTRQDAGRFGHEGRTYMVRWEQEPGSAGKRESFRLTRELAGIDAKGVPSTGDKLVRAKPLAVQAEAGNVKLLVGEWNEMFLAHMHAQPEAPHDDVMDAASGAFHDLVQPMDLGYAPSIWD